MSNDEILKMTGMEILFFANGNTAVCHDGKQQTHLQESWATLFASWLETHGRNPADYRVTLPNGLRARFFPTPENQWRLGLGCE
jgi:DNA gyrase inhibitor GyrI